MNTREREGVHISSEPVDEEFPMTAALTRMDDAFHLIGAADLEKIEQPRSKLAYMYLVARFLRSVAERRYDKVKDDCLRVGVLCEPYGLRVGMKVSCFNDERVNITVSKAAPISDFDYGKFLIAAMRAGIHDGNKFIDPKLDQAVQGAFVKRDPAITYEASLIDQS